MAWVTVLPGGVDDLRHGYTLRDLSRLARAAAATAGAHAADFADLLETAWSEIAEHLYAAEHPPPEHDLVAAGKRAIWDGLRCDRVAHGGASDAGYEPGTMRGFVRFWQPWQANTQSHEDGVVERLAIGQILPALTAGQRRAVLAVAAHGTPAAAADALAVTAGAVNVQLVGARRVVFGLWNEGETPPRRVWRTAGSTRRRTPVAGNLGGHCRRGHAFDEANTYQRSNGKRACRRCIADAAARGRRRQSVGGAVAEVGPGSGHYPRTRSAGKAVDRRRSAVRRDESQGVV